MILFVAASIYAPRLFAPQPRVNFLYASGENYPYGDTLREYSVQNGKLVKLELAQPEKGAYAMRYWAPVPYPASSTVPKFVEAKLFVHDVVKNESKEISFDDAQKLNLDSNMKSPDGFEVAYGNHDNGFPFFSGTDYDVRYLKGHNVSTKLNLQSNEPYYNYNFRFLGWIKN